MHESGEMKRHVHRRRDGVIEIRPHSWRQALTARETGLIIGLTIACGACTAAILWGGTRAPLLIAAAAAVVALAAARGVGTARTTARAHGAHTPARSPPRPAA